MLQCNSDSLINFYIFFQVSNLNLYRLGRKKSLGSRMVAYKFEPHDNWLPPCHRVPPHLERALIDTNVNVSWQSMSNMKSVYIFYFYYFIDSIVSVEYS